MARTTSALVQGVLRSASVGGDYDGSTSLTPYIDAANLVVTRVDTCATASGYTLTSDELEKIETWLAAHMYAMADQPYSSRTTSRASGAFYGQTGMHLDATKYGQTAKMLDPSGCLAALGKGTKGRMKWLGKAPSGQTEYVDRD